MNFLGILGENSNTQPKARGATLVCEWSGSISKPCKWDCQPHSTSNILYDFNGSGNHFQNNDPRYLLPYGSCNLKITEVEFDSDDDLIDGWLSTKGEIVNFLYKFDFAKPIFAKYAHAKILKLNESCKQGQISIRIHRR